MAHWSRQLCGIACSRLDKRRDHSKPPLAWLVGDAQQRRIARHYWIRDTFVGLLELATHRALRLVSIDLCSGFGAAIAHVSRYCYRDSERRARKLWIAIRPNDADRRSVDFAMTRLWQCVSRTMTEFSVLDRLWDSGRIAVTGCEHLDRARSEAKPILVAALHLGNWEVIAVAGIALGHRGSGIYLPPENRFEHRIVEEVRTRLGARLVPAGPNSGRIALRALKNRDGPFVIFVDEFIRGRVHAPAFGRPIRAEGNIAYAARLARMTGAVIIPAYCIRQGNGAWFHVTVLPPVELACRCDRDQELLENIARIEAVIAPIVRDHLDQWFYALDFELNN